MTNLLKTYLSPQAYRQLQTAKLKRKANKNSGPVWQPNPDHEDGRPNPQRLALESEADELFYGGQAGGGKTDLLLGCAILNHSRSVIFRRTFQNLKAVIRRSVEILGEEGFHKTEKRHNLGPGRFLEFGHMQHEDDKKNWQGQPHDFYGFDEPTELTRTQYQFVIGWLRHENPKQRCRVILAGNPPIDEAGLWLIEEWAPWLDPDFPDPAEPGELRWYYYDEENRLQWLKEPETVEVNGKRVKPKSRTFIPASLEDNPHYGDEYLSVLNSLPEPLRSAFRDGDFRAIMRQGDPFQIIPTAWVRAAQRRWLERKRPAGDPDAAGHDVSRGGQDRTLLVERWDTYFDITGEWPGIQVHDGPTAANLVHQALDGRDPGVLNVDVIGYGSSSYDSLKGMGYNAVPINVGEGSEYQDKSKKLTMLNRRAELAWRMRDALDPESGIELALPDDSRVVAELCSIRYVPLAGAKVKAESKEDIKERLGRSPDIGDAILLANYTPPRGLRISGMVHGKARGWQPN